ncbi:MULTISPECIES: transposase [unclassified Thiocapsa]|uniref:transposase n=1 Tax=unclassified Thiocapsa TaxID=2641286 RepID=UPI0035B27B1F
MNTPMPTPCPLPNLPPEQLAFLPPGEDEGTPSPKRAAAAVADALRGRRYKRGFEPSQPMLLPPSVEDDIAADNPARAIGVDVDLLVDVGELGFKHGAGAGGAGQPAFDPADLLKLYRYGDLNRVHSSRRLAAECQRNLEVMWLLKGLQPGDHTIADFRKDNAKALKAVNRQFMLLCRDPGLYGGTRVGLDGSFFNGNASAGSIKTKQQLERELAALERDIERDHEQIDTADAGEASGPAAHTHCRAARRAAGACSAPA